MIRIIHGEDSRIIGQYVKKIVRDFNTEDIIKSSWADERICDIRKYFSSKSILDENNKRIILYSDASFISNISKLEKREKDCLKKIVALAQEDSDTLLVIYANTKSVSKSKDFNNIFENVSVTFGKKPTTLDLKKYAMKYFDKKGISISNSSIDHIIDLTIGNYSIMLNEIKKLSQLGNDINESIIDSVVYDYRERKPFAIAEILLDGDPSKIEEEANFYEKNGASLDHVPGIIMSQLAYYLKVKKLMTDYDNDINKINKELNSNFYRLKISIEMLNDKKLEDIKILISEIYDFVLDNRKEGKKFINYLKEKSK